MSIFIICALISIIWFITGIIVLGFKYLDTRPPEWAAALGLGPIGWVVWLLNWLKEK